MPRSLFSPNLLMWLREAPVLGYCPQSDSGKGRRCRGFLLPPTSSFAASSGLWYDSRNELQLFPFAAVNKLYSVSSRNEYRKISGIKGGQSLRLIIQQPSVSRLSRRCGILSISRACRPPVAMNCNRPRDRWLRRYATSQTWG
jgi:hypothetical protein